MERGGPPVDGAGRIARAVFTASYIARARTAGYGIYLASTLDGPLGIAAALHCAALIAPQHACGLATLALFSGPDPLPPANGMIAAPTGPGLGGGLLEWYER